MDIVRVDTKSGRMWGFRVGRPLERALGAIVVVLALALAKALGVFDASAPSADTLGPLVRSVAELLSELDAWIGSAARGS